MVETRKGWIKIEIHSPRGRPLSADMLLQRIIDRVKTVAEEDHNGCHVTISSQVRDDPEDWWDPSSVKDIGPS